MNIDGSDVETGHQSTSCDYKLPEESEEIFDNVENLKPFHSNKIKMAVVCIARHITRNEYQGSKSETKKKWEYILIQLTVEN